MEPIAPVQVPPLRVHRIAAGLTQRDLARLTGVCQETVSNVERGATIPSRRTAAAIAAALSLEVVDIFSAVG